MPADQYTIKIALDDKGRQYFVHLRCGHPSYNPNDIRFKYCAVCHTFPEEQRQQALLKENIKLAEKRAVQKGFV